MKIYLANYTPEKLGGGHTFARTLYKHASDNITLDYNEADTYFITGPTICERNEVFQAKRDGKKVILRADNIVRHSRNRGTGMPRLKDFAECADLVIYQSDWCRRLLLPFTKRDGQVILNGVDTSIYNDSNRHCDDDSYLYVRSSRDEGKQWIMAYYWFVNNPGHLDIVGKFSYENLEYNFDFYNGERFTFLGEQKNMIDIYKRNKYFLYTYLNDCCSNTATEALMSGCEIIDVFGMTKTGGMPEILDAWHRDPKLLDARTMTGNYMKAIENIL